MDYYSGISFTPKGAFYNTNGTLIEAKAGYDTRLEFKNWVKEKFPFTQNLEAFEDSLKEMELLGYPSIKALFHCFILEQIEKGNLKNLEFFFPEGFERFVRGSFEGKALKFPQELKAYLDEKIVA